MWIRRDTNLACEAGFYVLSDFAITIEEVPS